VVVMVVMVVLLVVMVVLMMVVVVVRAQPDEKCSGWSNVIGRLQRFEYNKSDV
jgi:hypothetical protein